MVLIALQEVGASGEVFATISNEGKTATFEFRNFDISDDTTLQDVLSTIKDITAYRNVSSGELSDLMSISHDEARELEQYINMEWAKVIYLGIRNEVLAC
jgi:hypothetical protein